MDECKKCSNDLILINNGCCRENEYYSKEDGC